MHGHRHHHEHQAQGGGSIVSVLPKVIGVLVVIGLLRAVMGHKGRHGGRAAWFERRREAIAALHRELHTEDAAAAS